VLSRQTPVCPDWLLQQAQALPTMPTAIVNAGSKWTLASARLAFTAGLIEPVLIGEPKKIASAATELQWDITNLEVIAATDEQMAAHLGVAQVRKGRVQLLMKGQLHTDALLRAILDKQTGLRTGARLSHLFHLTVPDSDKALCIADAVINVQPDLQTQLSILRNAIVVMHALGYKRPRIALLSATEVVTKAMPSSIQAHQLLDLMTSTDHTNAHVYGPLAMDCAISPRAASIKGIAHPVAGNADLLLVPNIETGNALFKQLVYFNAATAAGIVMGAKVPVILTSRADPPTAQLAAVALAVIYTHHLRQLSHNALI
jgi:phosphotransacetylase